MLLGMLYPENEGKTTLLTTQRYIADDFNLNQIAVRTPYLSD
jgi:hypothetical protein